MKKYIFLIILMGLIFCVNAQNKGKTNTGKATQVKPTQPKKEQVTPAKPKQEQVKPAQPKQEQVKPNAVVPAQPKQEQVKSEQNTQSSEKSDQSKPDVTKAFEKVKSERVKEIAAEDVKSMMPDISSTYQKKDTDDKPITLTYKKEIKKISKDIINKWLKESK